MIIFKTQGGDYNGITYIFIYGCAVVCIFVCCHRILQLRKFWDRSLAEHAEKKAENLGRLARTLGIITLAILWKFCVLFVEARACVDILHFYTTFV